MKENELKEERKERMERGEHERKVDKSFELLTLCKEMLQQEGETWHKSKERRELERVKEMEKRDRIMKAEGKKAETLTKLNKKKLQITIRNRIFIKPNSFIG